MQQPPPPQPPSNPGQPQPQPPQFVPRGIHHHAVQHIHHAAGPPHVGGGPPTVSAATGMVVSQGGSGAGVQQHPPTSVGGVTPGGQQPKYHVVYIQPQDPNASGNSAPHMYHIQQQPPMVLDNFPLLIGLIEVIDLYLKAKR